jgi:hypothetical protein
MQDFDNRPAERPDIQHAGQTHADAGLDMMDRQMTALEFHPLADIFPLVASAEVAVAQQIAEHGAVYLIGTKRGGAVKIGHAIDVHRRLKDLRTGFPGGAIYVLSFIPGSKRIEAGLHELFSDLRIHGEWFVDREMEVSSTFEELLRQFCDGRLSL